MTLPSDNIRATIQAQRTVNKTGLTGGIISHLAQVNANKEGSTAPLINNLKITEVFKDKDKEEEISIIDLIRQVSQLLKAELKELVDVA